MKTTGNGQLLQAAGLIVVAMTLIGLIDNFVAWIAQHGGLWQFHAMRALFALPAIGLIGVMWGLRLRPRNWWAVGLRTAALATSMLLYFGSLALMPIAVVGAGLFTAPIFVQLISVIFFRVRLGMFRIAAVLVGFAGVLTVLRPWDGGLTATALLPVLAGFLYALSGVFTRHLCAREGTFSLLFGFFAALGAMGLIGLAVVPPGMGATFFSTGWVTPDATFLWLTAMQAIVSIAGIGMITRSYQIAEPTYVAIFEYWFLVAATFFAWVIWGQALDLTTFAGIAMIAGAGITIVLRSGRDAA